MLLLCNCSLQTANALDDVVFPTVPLLGIGEEETTAAGGTKSGDRRWGTGGRGQVGEDGMGAGGTISLKGQFNSRFTLANGTKLSSCVCCQKLCQGQMSALAASTCRAAASAMLQRTLHPPHQGGQWELHLAQPTPYSVARSLNHEASHPDRQDKGQENFLSSP